MLCRELPPPRCSPQRHRLLARDTDATRDSTRHPDTVDGPRFFPRPAGLTAPWTRLDRATFRFHGRPPRNREIVSRIRPRWKTITERSIVSLGNSRSLCR